MTNSIRPVTVRQLPKKTNMKQRRLFFRELKRCMDGDRPRIVLDCSNLSECDRSVVLLLLRCLEEAIKRNGDVKLAAVGPTAARVLDLTGANRLFEIFDTPAEAADSFHGFAVDAISPAFLSENSQRRESESAA